MKILLQPVGCYLFINVLVRSNASKYILSPTAEQIHAEQHFLLASVYQPDLLRNPLLWKLNVPNMTPIDFLEYSACFKNNVLHRPPGEVEGTLWLKTLDPDRNIKPVIFFRRVDMSVLFNSFFVTHWSCVYTEKHHKWDHINISIVSSIQQLDYTVQMESLAFDFWL